MTIYPDAINVVKAQRRISEFTTPDEFASRNSRNGRTKSRRAVETGFGSWRTWCTTDVNSYSGRMTSTNRKLFSPLDIG